jgi:hypothetical protein
MTEYVVLWENEVKSLGRWLHARHVCDWNVTLKQVVTLGVGVNWIIIRSDDGLQYYSVMA